jgi:hypothetical protein
LGMASINTTPPRSFLWLATLLATQSMISSVLRFGSPATTYALFRPC